jgi:hypothetical protein
MVSHGASPYMTQLDTSRGIKTRTDTPRYRQCIAYLTPPVLMSPDTARHIQMHGDAGGGIVKLLKQGPKREWGCLPRLAGAVTAVLLATWLVVS